MAKAKTAKPAKSAKRASKNGRPVKTAAAIEEGQLHIPGMEPVFNPKVHPKAIHYGKMRDARIAANKDESEAHDTLLTAMLEEGLEDYTYKGLTVHVDKKQKCKVKTTAAKDDNGDE